MNWLLAPFSLIWKHRLLLQQTTWNDIRARYAGSALGLFWLILYPLIFLGVYALVYVYVFQVRFAEFNSLEYVALIFCGLIPFIGFSESLGAGVGSVTGNANLIKNTLFPIELVPVKATLTSQVTQAVGTVLLLLAIGGLGKLSFWALWLPAIWLCQVLFTLGLIWILSGLNVFVRDLQNMVSVIILVLMLVSPIAYTANMVPPALQPFLAINPLYYIITAYQNVLMLGQLPPLSMLAALIGFSLGSFWLGYWFFDRLKPVFVDYA